MTTITRQTKAYLNRKVVLCFGDSNTFGQRPDSDERFDENTRWTCQLQRLVTDSFYVVEEGLGGRTVDRDRAGEDGFTKNGWTYFQPCLRSHCPDVVIITLGTNDCQIQYEKTAPMIATSLEKYIDVARRSGASRVLLVAPAPIDSSKLLDPATGVSDRGTFDRHSVEISKILPVELRKVAEKHRVDYIDTSDYVSLGQDGLHWDEPSHARFAEAIAQWLD